mmetsp:Transcript_32100/g.73335  ORF Transcript_32100/g.73335 Transcript_32100/m.73335 type:complete len:877 (-) Transcript_32100:264-2894(-)
MKTIVGAGAVAFLLSSLVKSNELGTRQHSRLTSEEYDEQTVDNTPNLFAPAPKAHKSKVGKYQKGSKGEGQNTRGPNKAGGGGPSGPGKAGGGGSRGPDKAGGGEAWAACLDKWSEIAQRKKYSYQSPCEGLTLVEIECNDMMTKCAYSYRSSKSAYGVCVPFDPSDELWYSNECVMGGSAGIPLITLDDGEQANCGEDYAVKIAYSLDEDDGDLIIYYSYGPGLPVYNANNPRIGTPYDGSQRSLAANDECTLVENRVIRYHPDEVGFGASATNHLAPAVNTGCHLPGNAECSPWWKGEFPGFHLVNLNSFFTMYSPKPAVVDLEGTVVDLAPRAAGGRQFLQFNYDKYFEPAGHKDMIQSISRGGTGSAKYLGDCCIGKAASVLDLEVKLYPTTDQTGTVKLYPDVPTAPEETTKTVEEILKDGSVSTDGFIVLHGGEIVVEKYYKAPQQSGSEFDLQTTNHRIWSQTKGFVGLMVEMLIDNGKVNEGYLISQYIPELKSSDVFHDVTIRQLLDMSTDFVTTYYGSFYPLDIKSFILDNNKHKRTPSPDVEYPANKPDHGFCAATPMPSYLSLKQCEHGEKFGYRDTNTQILGWLVDKVKGDGDQALSDDIWAKIEAEGDMAIKKDDEGFTDWAAGGMARLSDMARFGQAVLDSYNDKANAPFNKHVIEGILTGGKKDQFAASDSDGNVGRRSYRNFNCLVNKEFGGQVGGTCDNYPVVESYLKAMMERKEGYYNPRHEGFSYHSQFWVLNGRMMCMLGYRGNHVFIIPEADVVIAKSASPPNIGEFDDTYGAMGDENGQIRMALEIAAHYIDKQNNSQPPAQSVYCPAACPKGHFIVGCDMNNPWHCLPGRKCLFGWNKNFGEIWVHGPYCGF